MLIARLELAPVADPQERAFPLAAGGPAANRPRIFAGTVFGKILTGLAMVWLLLALLALVGPGPVPNAVFVVPSLSLVGYYYRAWGALKVEPSVLTAMAAAKGNENDQNDWQNNG